jgi:hypothetical protein
MLYYGVQKNYTLLPTFDNRLTYYGQYINDGLGILICDPNPEIDSLRWESFQQTTGFGKLVWDVSERSLTVNFLNLRLSLLPFGGIKTSNLYEKALNLHLYLSPLSAHPPGLLPGVIHGMLYRIILLTSDRADT